MEENKLVWWVAAVIAVLAIVAFLLYYMETPLPWSEEGFAPLPVKDSVSSVESDINAADFNNLSGELSDIDKALAQ